LRAVIRPDTTPAASFARRAPAASFARRRSRRTGGLPGVRGRGVEALAAALTALAFVASSLFGLIHEATTVHVRCAHGELIDSDVVAQANAARGVPARSLDAAHDDLLRGTLAFAVHGHEHCALMSAMRESRLAPRPPVIAPAQVAVADLAAAPPRVETAPGDALYRTAPKTSPPA
jgi:hypothetical protein